MIDFEDLFSEIYAEYGKEKGSIKIANLMDMLSSGKGSYHDLYNYASRLGDGLGKIIKKKMNAWEFLDNREELKEQGQRFVDVLKQYHNDITDASELVQKAINEGMGIHIAPQNVRFNEKYAGRIAGQIVNLETNAIERAIENFGMKTVDDLIHANADFLSDIGFTLKVVRKYDNVGVHTQKSANGGTPWKKQCTWCKEREGVYDYLDVKEKGNKVWQRHEGCGCSIDYYDEKGKKETVNNFVKSKKRNLEPDVNVVKSSEFGRIKTKLGVALKTDDSKFMYKVITENPSEIFSQFTPETLKKYFNELGLDTKPLSKGNYKNVSFEDGGGYRINFGGDGVFLYHPKKRSHHGGAYYKISIGNLPIIRFDMKGDIIYDK